MEVAALGLRVDASGVDGAAKSLENLTTQGARAEKSLSSVEGAASKTGNSLKTLGDGSAKGLGAVSSSASAAAASVQGLGGSTKSAQLSLREMLAQAASASQSVAQLASAMTAAANAAQAGAKAQADAAKSAQEMGRAFQAASEQAKGYSAAAQQAFATSKEGAAGASEAFGLLRTAMVAVASLTVVKQFATMADAMTNVNSRLKLVTSSSQELVTVQAQLFSVAQSTRIRYTDLVDTFAQMSRATKELGVSQRDMLKVTETISQAVTISGGSAASAQAALVQLSQGFAAGALRGEELNSVMEQTPRLAQAIAQGLGVSIGELRRLGGEGELTAEKVLGALQKSSEQVKTEFDQMSVTIEQSLTRVGNSVMNLVGTVDQLAGASSGVAGIFSRFSTNLDSLDGQVKAMASANSLSDFFFTAFNTEQRLNEELAVTQSELSNLRTRLEANPDNIYLKSATADAQALVGQLNAAIGRMAVLKQAGSASAAGGNGDPYNDGSAYSGYQKLEKDREDAAHRLAQITSRQNGITKQFLADLKTYQDALKTGVITEKEYAEAVNQANKKRYEGTEAGKEAAKQAKANAAAGKHEQTAYMGLKASIEEKIALNQQEVNFSGRINEAQKAEIKLNEDLRSGKLKLTAADEATLRARIEIWKQQEKQKDQAKREVAMYQQQSEAAQQLADEYVRQSKAVESVRVASDKADQALRDQLERMGVEESMIGRTTAARELAVAMLDAEIERRNALNAIDSNLDINETVRQEQRIKVEERYALRVSLAQRKVYVTEWDKTSQLISDTLSDYIMRGGEDAAQYLKRLFATLVLQPVVQAVVGGLIGGGGAGGAAATSLLGSGASGLVSNLLFGGMSLTTVGSSIGAGIMATLTGSSLGGAGAAGILAGGSSALGMLGGALPYLGAGLAVLKILSGDWFGSRGPNHSGGVASTATQDRAEAARQALGVDAWGNTLGDFTSRGNAEIDKQLDTTLKGMLDLYKQLAKIGGATVKDIDIAAGFSVNPKHGDEGAMGFFQIIDKATGEILSRFKDREMDTDPQKAWAKFVAEMGGALVTEIKKGDIPGWMKEELDALGDDVTLEGLNAAIQRIAVIDAAFKGWADTVIGFANLTAKAQTELLKFSNGIEALANNVNAFYASFYSEQERAEILQRQVRDQLKKLGIDIDPAGGEAAKKAFRKLIEDALASGNNELAAKLLALAQLFGVAADAAQKSAEVAADAAKTAAEEAARALEEAQQKAKDLAMANFEAAIAREQQYWQAVASNAQEAVQAITGILTPLKQAAKELFGSIESAGQMQAVQGMLYIERAIAGLRGGAKLSSYDGLTDAISAARGGITSGRYASQFERDRDALVLANQLKQIAGFGDLQLSVEERQLKNSQEQLQKLDKTLGYWRDLLDGNKAQIDATLSVEAAIKALEALLFPEKPPASGGGSGPGKTPTPDWGGGGGGGFQPANSGKYKTPTAILGGGAVIYDYAAPDYEKRLDSLAPTFEKYRGTGDFTGLAEDFRAAGGTARDLAYLYGFSESDVLAALDRNGIPRFDVGTNRVPQDMLAMVHKNEAIVPAAFNPWAGGSLGGDLGLEFRAMRAELAQLREDQRAQASATLSLQRQTAKIIQSWDGDGLPHERQEQNA
ncbi:tape measure protein [Delftia sp. ZNC0008]|uniref:tape measure protein n=1 Tax=Delftia sp. ZNC0008 TaxID=1339242 RepID=UPI0009E03FF6|nr:tape measure protein [Delftia sp. ZNC0008]